MQRRKITKAQIPDTTVGAIIIDFMAKHQGQVLFWLFVGAYGHLGRLSTDQTAQDLPAGSQRLQFMQYKALQQD